MSQVVPPAVDPGSLPNTIGLALSGGGFRATLFHLGVIRYLCEAGALSRVGIITSVSGGSVMAAHLMVNWVKYTNLSTFDDVANELISLTQWNLRGRILLRKALFPFWSTTTHFERMLRKKKDFLDNKLLSDLDENAKLLILATNSKRGDYTTFTRNGINFEPSNSGKLIPGHCSLTTAVAASAAFPALFRPLKLTKEKIGADNSQMPSNEFLTDGGVWDNLGLRALMNLDGELAKKAGGRLELKIASNAGGHFDWDLDGRFSLFRNLVRITGIMMERIHQLELMGANNADRKDDKLKILNISQIIYGLPDTPLENIQPLLKKIRTDFNAFSDHEIDWLVRHGYCVARELLRFPERGGRPLSAWHPIPLHQPSRRIEEDNEKRLIKKAIGGAIRRLDIFNPRDWLCWAVVFIFFMIIVSFLGFIIPTSFLPDFFPKQRLWMHNIVSTRNDVPRKSVIPLPERSTIGGLWRGRIEWDVNWAKKLIGPPLDPNQAHSDGEMTLELTESGSVRGTSHWKLINGTDVIAILIVDISEFTFDENGALIGLDLQSVVRGIVGENKFKYGPAVHYRAKFSEHGLGKLRGDILGQDQDSTNFQKVGTISFWRN